MNDSPPEKLTAYQALRALRPQWKAGTTTALSYEIILADPPWSYRDSANAGKRGAVHKYRTLGLPEICALDVPGIAAPNCLLALWWVPPMPAEGLERSAQSYAQRLTYLRPASAVSP